MVIATRKSLLFFFFSITFCRMLNIKRLTCPSILPRCGHDVVTRVRGGEWLAVQKSWTSILAKMRAAKIKLNIIEGGTLHGNL